MAMRLPLARSPTAKAFGPRLQRGLHELAVATDERMDVAHVEPGVALAAECEKPLDLGHERALGRRDLPTVVHEAVIAAVSRCSLVRSIHGSSTTVVRGALTGPDIGATLPALSEPDGARLPKVRRARSPVRGKTGGGPL
jgi:hypothetical protein